MTVLFETWRSKALGAAALIAAALPCSAFAQATPALSTCADQPDVPSCDAVPGDRAGAQALHGFYRAGSDHRKDGQAVGW